ncbi:MAG: hypothetical protein KDC15_09450 [Chitinophagaceae bacterium]|nr:hypothetical protein [Chitinophagaceae bacterium]
MLKRFATLVFFTIAFNATALAQTDNTPVATFTTKQNRIKEYRNLLNNSIKKNLSLPLTDSTEEYWQDAFAAMELLQYHSPWIDGRVKFAFDSIAVRSDEFKRAFIELVYSNYPRQFVWQVAHLLKQTTNSRLFAMCSEYLLMNDEKGTYKDSILKRIDELLLLKNDSTANPFFTMLQNKILLTSKPFPLSAITEASFLKNEIVLFSFQRKNRNYPGLAMVRKKNGEFLQDASGVYFSVPQLARSLSNMPGYISNGNTPQGIFKMTGFGKSSGNFIGPTENIQMVLPFEKSEDIPDSVTMRFGNDYASLVPAACKDVYAFYEAWYAGLAGRTEIIAHGTTVNPAYYNNQPYYPLTPTQGCLCTKEIWSEVNGKRLISDQQKLVNALKNAGGAKGYCVVIEIDDAQKPVSLQDILPFLQK